MKTSVLLTLFLCSVCGLIGCAETSNKEARANVPGNAMDINGAIILASRLSYGMPETNALAFLKEHGLTLMVSLGDSLSWGDCFSLSNRCNLCLDIEPKPVSPDGAWINGHVRGARICNWNGDSEPIVLAGQMTKVVTNLNPAP